MKRLFGLLTTVLIILAACTGCGISGDKTASISWIYGVVTVLSFILLLGYCVLIKKKELWYLLLFGSVLVVNVGYWALSVSSSLEEALLANRIAYLGSVFLPFAMLMIILKSAGLQTPKWLPWLLMGIGVVILFIVASPGYLTIYYQEVELITENGVSELKKVYGPCHVLYLIYLMGYLGTMIGAIVHAMVKKTVVSAGQSAMMIIAVGVNLGIWFIEQLVDLHFEMLSVSYVISEFFLLGVHFMVAEQERLSTERQEVPLAPAAPLPEEDELDPEKAAFFMDGVQSLTHTERLVFEAYTHHKSTKEIMEELNIKENTLKYHNKNIYNKLGVRSRKELLEIYKQVSR